MIIPPDPEKDPNLFSPSASTHSLPLFPPPSEPDFDSDSYPSDPSDPSTNPTSIQSPPRAHVGRRNNIYDARYPFGDDLGVGYAGEALPPYRIYREVEDPVVVAVAGTGTVTVNGDGGVMRERIRRSVTNPTPLIIPSSTDRRPPSIHSIMIDTPTAPSFNSTTNLASSTLPASTSKLWESSTANSSSLKKKRKRILTWKNPDQTKKGWKRYSRVIQVGIVLVFTIVGAVVGAVVGVEVVGKKPHHQDPDPNAYTPWQDNSGKKANTQWPDGSLNLTYVDSRDGPDPSDGNMSLCNQFTSINSSNPLTYLSIPFPNSKLYQSTFHFPLNRTLSSDGYFLPGEFSVIARGIGSWGTVHFIGSDGNPDIIQGGSMGEVRVDVVVQYAGEEDVNTFMRVCQMQQENNGMGVGIYTPIETDGKISNPYMLDPSSLPSFSVIIRLPPGMLSPTPDKIPTYFPSLSLSLDRMAARFGDLSKAATFGIWNVTTGRGGIVAEYVSARDAYATVDTTSVRGVWNVTNNLAINATDGSIIAGVVLHNPHLSNDTSATLPPPSPYTKRSFHSHHHKHHLDSRGVSNFTSFPIPASTSDPAEEIPAAVLAATDLSNNHTVNTSFITTQGYLSVSFLHHPPRTALTALLANMEGETSLTLHPNYVGPWAVKSMYSDISLQPPKANLQADPFGLGRTRTLGIAAVTINPGSLFAANGFNQSNLQGDSSVTGAAGWDWVSTSSSNDTDSDDQTQGGSGSGSGFGGWIGPTIDVGTEGQELVDQVQNSQEGEGSEVVVMGAWGDVVMSFDGT